MSAHFILASASPTRREILSAAGVPFEIKLPDVDEDRIKDELLDTGAAAGAIATALAEQKAMDVSARAENILVLGADQVLVCDGELFSKAKNLTEARESLKRFRGRRHELISAMALVRDETTEWLHLESAELWVRDFSEAFLDAYLEQEGAGILGSVGCYRIEGGGAQLFEKIIGDQFTIRGLPLFPLLGALRARGIMAK
ncbi:MAG: nucleoside triphosphate pyrophosphatase [Micropepsaceae bacterium]